MRARQGGEGAGEGVGLLFSVFFTCLIGEGEGLLFSVFFTCLMGVNLYCFIQDFLPEG